MKTVSALLLSMAAFAVPTVGWANNGDRIVVLAQQFEQRTDVEEVLLPPPPRGPATPIPFCNPSSPICP